MKFTNVYKCLPSLFNIFDDIQSIRFSEIFKYFKTQEVLNSHNIDLLEIRHNVINFDKSTIKVLPALYTNSEEYEYSEDDYEAVRDLMYAALGLVSCAGIFYRYLPKSRVDVFVDKADNVYEYIFRISMM